MLPVLAPSASGASRALSPVTRLTLRSTAMAEKLIADNRRARHDYELLERVEAGLVLTGTEVKALREGRATLRQAFADVRDSEIWLVGAEIAAYDQGGIANHEPDARPQAAAAPARDRPALRPGRRRRG